MTETTTPRATLIQIFEDGAARIVAPTDLARDAAYVAHGGDVEPSSLYVTVPGTRGQGGDVAPVTLKHVRTYRDTDSDYESVYVQILDASGAMVDQFSYSVDLLA